MTKSGQFPKYQFAEQKRLHPLSSDLTCFIDTIRKSKSLHQRLVKKWFPKLVDKDDYAKEDKSEVLRFLISLTDRNTFEG